MALTSPSTRSWEAPTGLVTPAGDSTRTREGVVASGRTRHTVPELVSPTFSRPAARSRPKARAWAPLAPRGTRIVSTSWAARASTVASSG